MIRYEEGFAVDRGNAYGPRNIITDGKKKKKGEQGRSTQSKLQAMRVFEDSIP